MLSTKSLNAVIIDEQEDVVEVFEDAIEEFKQQMDEAYKDFDLNYSRAFNFADRMYPYLASAILNLGDPELSVELPTASVGISDPLVHPDTDDVIILSVNPLFAHSLGAIDYSFVLCHEVMHVLMGHLLIFDEFEDKQRFNIATDCIINDFLDNSAVMMTKKLEDLPLMRGRDIVGFDCSYSSVQDVYDKIPKEYHSSAQGDNQEGGMSGQGGMPGQGGTPGSLPGPLDDHSGWGNLSPEQKNELREAAKNFVDDIWDKLPPEMKDFIYESNDDVREDKKDERPSEGWSNEAGLPQSSSLDKSIDLNWTKLINKITPDTFNSHRNQLHADRSFSRPNKKLVTVYPKAVLPASFDGAGGVGNGRKSPNTYVMALDCSGSIPPEMQKKLQKLALSLPTNKIKLFCCTFSTYVREFDPTSSTNTIASGGTDFGAIHKWIKKSVVPKVGHYPKAVLVLTDGYAMCDHTMTDDELKNWHWLITLKSKNPTCSDGRAKRICEGQFYTLDDFIK